MVNKTQFYKTKVALAVVLSLGLAACGDSDGDANTSTSESVVEDNSGNSSEQAQGTGSVQGTVLDTNGLPVIGATVRLSGQTVTTDASGYYHFTDVPVAGVDGSNSTNEQQGVYFVTITGPEGYASATVEVTSQNIQIDSGNNGTNGDETTSNGEQITWFDGFLAQADTANLPMFSSTVTGVLRDCYTGAALPAGVKVALDFTAITTTGTNTGTNVNVGVPTFTTTTAEGGLFSFDALPTDSDFTLAVEGYAEDDTNAAPGVANEFQEGGVSTTAEGIINNLGDLEVCAISSSDNINPYISSVDSTIDTNTGEGFSWEVLTQGVDGVAKPIVLRFNEALDASLIDTSRVAVTTQVDFYNLNAGEQLVSVASAELADDGLSMTITLAAALPERTKFSVWMPRHEYQDTSGNRIVTGDAAGNEFVFGTNNDDLVFDAAGTSTALIPAIPGTPAVDAVAAVASTGDLEVNLASGVTVTAVTAGVAGDGFTVDVDTTGAPGIVVTFSATGIVITTDANSTITDIANAITTNASSLVTATVYGNAAALVTTDISTTTAGGVDEVVAVAAIPETPAVPAVEAGATGSSEKGISSDTINDSEFKTEFVRTRLCTYISPSIDPGSIEGEQLVKQVVAADDSIDAVGVFWDNGGSATISNLNGQHDQTQDLLQELWNRKNTTSTQTIIDDTAVITGDLNDASNIISDAGTTSVTATTWSVSVPGAEHGDEVTVTPTAAFGIVGTPITVILEDKVAPTTVIQDSYNYADTFGDQYVNAIAADAGFANGGELSQIGTSGSEGSPILYVTPRLFAKDEANDDDANFNNRQDVFRTLAEGNTADTNGDAYVTSNRNFVYDVNAIANWGPTSATVGVAFSENINLVTSESVEFSVANTTPSTTLTDFTANNSQRNEDYVANDTDQDGYHTYLTHGLIQMTSNDIVGLANLDHNGVLDYTGAVSDTVNGNVALSDALVVIADAIPPLVTKAELDATTFVVTFNEPVVAGTSSITITNPDSADLSAPYSVLLSSASSNADNTVWTWSASTTTLPSRALFSNTTTGTAFTGQLDGGATFNGAAELETVSGNFAYAETTGGSVLNHSLLTWSDVNDTRGNNWAEYRALYTDAGTMVGSTANDGIIDSQQDTDASTNEWRLALQDVPVYLATDTIAAFTVQVGLSVTYDNQASPEIDAEFVATVTSTHPLNLDTDQWGGANVAVWDNLAEITANFAILDTASGPGAVCIPGTTATDTNDDNVVDALDYCTVDLSAGTATWNADNTVLTLNLTQATALTINSAAGFEFRKISNNIITDNGGLDTVQNGRVVSTIVDSQGDEQSQNVKREF